MKRSCLHVGCHPHARALRQKLPAPAFSEKYLARVQIPQHPTINLVIQATQPLVTQFHMEVFVPPSERAPQGICPLRLTCTSNQTIPRIQPPLVYGCRNTESLISTRKFCVWRA